MDGLWLRWWFNCFGLGNGFLVQAEVPIFGFGKGEGGTYENIRATNLLVAIWFAVFSIPTFLFVKIESLTQSFTKCKAYSERF